MDIRFTPETKILIDNCCDYIPGVSTITNFVELFINNVYDPTKNTTTPIENDRFSTHIKEKSIVRSVVLLFPGLGNILVALYDCASWATKAMKPQTPFERYTEKLRSMPETAEVTAKKAAIRKQVKEQGEKIKSAVIESCLQCTFEGEFTVFAGTKDFEHADRPCKYMTVKSGDAESDKANIRAFLEKNLSTNTFFKTKSENFDPFRFYKAEFQVIFVCKEAEDRWTLRLCTKSIYWRKIMGYELLKQVFDHAPILDLSGMTEISPQEIVTILKGKERGYGTVTLPPTLV